MKLNPITPKQTLNKGFLKQRPLRSEIETFKTNLKTLLSKVEVKESEEHKKNHVRDFLLDTYYKGKNEVNTKDRKDLVIHLGKTNADKVGVIIEAKSPDNKAEMVRLDRLHSKAFYELVLYYFDERHRQNNAELKNLVVTDAHEWFVFDANVFDKQIYRNGNIKRLYEIYQNDRKDNPFFYEELRKILENNDETIDCAYFNLKDYADFLINADLEDDKNLIELFKILSPYHLLKEPFANDSNALNKPFYDELLHIIGLEEIKEKSKTIIQRKAETRRNSGSLLENAMTILKTKDLLRKVKDISNYGETPESRYFNVALELCLTWINRILFLKLLESQLVSYHRGNRDYRFLNIETIPDFDELFTLFHQVLAKTTEDREPENRAKYRRVPYLNSSLFEISELEDQTISIESLKDTVQLPFINTTVLQSLKANGQTLNTLEYLFRFLDAYDFASEGFEAIQADNRSLINASVLGKVFEKINGYKDGSIFTPGFITMYMCRQAIRLAVVQKFKERYQPDIDSFDDLKNFVGAAFKTERILEYNQVINSIKLCDPAVGSGHFLVSSLNEIIAIKSELGILADDKGLRLSDFEIHIENDELIISDEKGDIFEYQLNENGQPTPKAHRLQKTLFHEKQTLIENCLFGVDINPNSVKICRLRLWIELLKNAYYKESGGYAELETLPNIDINIKCGNSLISRFALDEDLKEVLQKIKCSVSDYRNFVLGYKETRDRDQKRDFEEKIQQIKADVKTQLFFFSPERRKLADLQNQLRASESKQFLFGEDEAEQEKRLKFESDLKAKIEKANEAIKQIEENAIYKNAFEWRFEFPEILDNDGNFLGFDVVIGNPPYIRQEELGKQKDYLKKDYQVYAGTADLLVYFYELGIRILQEQGAFSFITSNKFMRANYGKALREFLGKYRLSEIIDFGDAPVFDGIAAYASIVNLQKSDGNGENQTRIFNFPVNEMVKDFENSLAAKGFFLEQKHLSANGWQLEQSETLDLLAKLRSKGKPLGDYVNGRFYYGIKTGLNEAFVVDLATRNRLIAEDKSSAEVLKPFLRGRDVKRWSVNYADLYLIQIESSSNKNHTWSGKDDHLAEQIFAETYPAIFQHLQNYRSNLIKRDDKGLYYWELRACIYWNEFEQPKIFYPDIYLYQSFAWDESGFFSGNTCYFIPTNEKWLVSLLNSKLIEWFYSQISNKIRGGYLRAFSDYMRQIPIPQITPEEQQPFIKLVDDILQAKKNGEDTTGWERQIDKMVYQLYGLDDEEIKIVEGN